MKISQVMCGTAPIVLLYGGEGRGKSTLASKFPKPLAMLLERGLPAGVKLDAVDGLGAYAAVLESIRDAPVGFDPPKVPVRYEPSLNKLVMYKGWSTATVPLTLTATWRRYWVSLCLRTGGA